MRKTSFEEIKIIAEKNFFYWGVNNEGNFWKRYKHYNWKNMTFQDQPKYGLSSSIIASRGQCYWTLEGNGTVIRRDDNVPLNQVKRRMFIKQYIELLVNIAVRYIREEQQKSKKNCFLFCKNV